jgi:hypothetical protein
MCVVVEASKPLSGKAGLRSASGLERGHFENLGVNSTFTLAAQQRHVSIRHWDGAIAYRRLCTISMVG